MSDYNKFVPEDDDAYERQLYEQRKAREQLNSQDAEKAQRDAERKREAERRKQLEKDRVELMKLRSGVIEESETIKEEEKVERVLTKKEKIANFFYHYKIPIIVCSIMAVALGYIIYDTVSRDDPDLYVLSTCNNGLDYRTDELEEYFEQFCPDLNGDGEVHVQIITAPDSNDYQIKNANQTKIMAQLQMDETIIILTCDDNYNLKAEIDEDGYYAEGTYMFADIFADLTTVFPDNESVDVKGYQLEGESVKEALGWAEMPDNIIMSLRAPVKPLHGDLETMEENFEIALDLMKKVMEDNGDL